VSRLKSPSRATRTPFETYLSEIDRTPLLTAAEEHELARRVQAGDVEARDRMARANLRLVVNIARGFTNRGLPLEDLVAEGNMGLLRAIEGFDAGMSTRFSTYASFWVRQSIRRALSMSGRTVRLPHYVTTLLAKWRRATNAMREELGRTPTDAEVAAELGLSGKRVRVVREALRAAQAGATGDDDGTGFADALPDAGPAPGERLAGSEELTRALGSLDRLDEREQAVLRLRFGLDGTEPATLQEVGARLELTRERVRQIERDALVKLRAHLAA
jgi:RNA polymerase primary sigma factor